MTTLKSWFIVSLTHPVAIGKLYNDRTFPDGYEITTKRVLKVDLENNLLVTENKIYSLDSIDKVWAKTSEANILKELA